MVHLTEIVCTAKTNSSVDVFVVLNLRVNAMLQKSIGIFAHLVRLAWRKVDGAKRLKGSGKLRFGNQDAP